MIIVDKALKKREESNDPVKVGIIGAGYIGKGATIMIENYVPGMKTVAIYNRTISRAARAFDEADISQHLRVNDPDQMDQVISDGGYTYTDDPFVLCRAKNVDVIIEATGEIEFGAKVTLEAIKNNKHVVLMNAELDATLGPILKTYADEQGVIITNADGDQPGVVMNLFRFVEMIGYNPVVAGNIKGLQDAYRTPETQKEFAEKNKMSPKMCTSFADGTKLCMEMAVVANATGFKTAIRGMHGPACDHVKKSLELLPKEDMLNGGIVDYVLGAEPGPGVFVIGYNEHPVLSGYMKTLKMGDGPFYLFYVPYHLPHLEVSMTAARAVLFNDAAIAPLGKPVCEVITIAKTDLKSGTKLDGIGGFTCYGTIENSDISRSENLLPMGLSEWCTLKKDIPKDEAISFDDVEIDKTTLSYNLWKEQINEFNIA
jgi:predicted homoserine dehydrogenase-like protein